MAIYIYRPVWSGTLLLKCREMSWKQLFQEGKNDHTQQPKTGQCCTQHQNSFANSAESILQLICLTCLCIAFHKTPPNTLIPYLLARFNMLILQIFQSFHVTLMYHIVAFWNNELKKKTTPVSKKVRPCSPASSGIKPYQKLLWTLIALNHVFRNP